MLSFEELEVLLIESAKNRQEEKSREEKLREAYPGSLQRFQLLPVSEHPSIIQHVCDKLEVTEEALRAKQRWISIDMLSKILSPSEIAQFVEEFGGSYQLREEILWEHPPVFWFHKILSSAWVNGMERLSWAEIVNYHRFFLNFDFGSDFEVRFDYTGNTAESGPAWLSRKIVNCRYVKEADVWLDGTFGLFIYYKDEHVLTISVSPTKWGLKIHQIQSRQKKGNRWLYKLPKPFFEYAIERVYAACDALDITVFLVEGEHAANTISKEYDDCAEWRGEHYDRIVWIYNQELSSFRRIKPVKRLADKFWRLKRILKPKSARL